jgi:hypothetical protein
MAFNNLLWNVFEKVGSVDAYLGYNDYRKSFEEKSELSENIINSNL